MATSLTKKEKSSGVTIQELLIVVMIISILATIAIWYFRSQIHKGNDGKKKADIRRIQVALEEYEKDNDCYPVSLPACKPGDGFAPYLSKIPCDPVTGAGYFYEPDPSSVCPRWYRMYSKLDFMADTDIGKVGCSYGCGPGLAFNYYASSPNAPNPAAGASEEDEGNGPPPTGFYGCKAAQGGCVPISWDSSRPGPECDPNYQNVSCFNQCGPMTECSNWNP